MNPTTPLLLLSLLGAALAAAEVNSLSLDAPAAAAVWSVSSASPGTANVTGVASTVPGDVYGDLMRSAAIGNPYYRYNDERYRYIAYANWTFTRAFAFPHCHAGGEVQLIFAGLQTVATIYVDGRVVGTADDEFRRYAFNVEHVVCGAKAAATHNLTVAFESSVHYAARQYAAYDTTTPKPVAPAYIGGLPHRNMVRTEQSSFGWDWGPAFAPQGIYRPVSLEWGTAAEVAPNARVVYVTPHVFPLPFGRAVTAKLSDAKNKFWIDVRVFVHVAAAARGGNVTGTLRLTAPSLGQSNRTAFALAGAPYDAAEGLYELQLSLYAENAALWWPNGYGAPATHRVEYAVAFSPAPGGKAAAQELTGSFRTGLRAIELVTYGDPKNYTLQAEPRAAEFQRLFDVELGAGAAAAAARNGSAADAVGDRPVMFFRVNGVPVFAKGANVVPFDAFQSRVNATTMRPILDAAVAANMNTVRVWGGGLFPLRSFYDMCDARGLMVWQEMIFACAAYPVDAPFLDNVRKEIRHQMRRLGRHPSIAMWSGNNENGIYDKGPGSPYEVLDYGNVMYEVIRQDTSRPVWPSSPSRGFASGVTASGLPAGTMADPAPFKVGGDSGDTHYYNYFTCPNVSVYPRTNFASEYGFQSLPWFDNIAPVTAPEDWSLFSKLMEHRQHHPKGNQQIAALLAKNFDLAGLDLNSTALAVFKRVIFLSQLQQTLCIADEASFYRRGRDMPYRTMGSLYWQLNQNWQAPSWTSLEYGGEWKVLHYAMLGVYDAIHVSAFVNETTQTAVAHVASDRLESAAVVVDVYLLPFKLTAAADALSAEFLLESVPVVVPPLSGVFFWRAPYAELLRRNATRCPTAGDCFVYYVTRDAVSVDAVLRHRSGDRGAAVVAPGAAAAAQAATLWLTVVKDAKLQPAPVTVVVEAVDGTTARVRFASTGVSVYTFPHVTKPEFAGHFDRNAFVLLPGVPQTLLYTVTSGQNISDAAAFSAAIVVESLNQDE
jgi:beta-mannosidase